MATILELAQKMQRGEVPPPPIGRLLGFVLKVIEPGRAVFEMEADERHHNPMGTLHGGVYCDLADAAMGYAYAATLGEGETFTTIELKINFLRAVRQGTLTAEARVVKAGSALGYVECDVKDQAGKLVARAASTCMKLRRPPPRRSLRAVSAIAAMGATMANQMRWKLVACTIMLSVVVLGGVVVYGRIGEHRPGGSPIDVIRNKEYNGCMVTLRRTPGESPEVSGPHRADASGVSTAVARLRTGL